jgi:elongation factor P
VGDAKNYLVENGSVTVTFVDDKAVSIEMPSSVVLKVSDAPEGIRGDSSNNVQKPIVLETGITVQAPLFIKTGEKSKWIRARASIWSGRSLVPNRNHNHNLFLDC